MIRIADLRTKWAAGKVTSFWDALDFTSRFQQKNSWKVKNVTTGAYSVIVHVVIHVLLTLHIMPIMKLYGYPKLRKSSKVGDWKGRGVLGLDFAKNGALETIS